MNGLLNLN